MSHKNISKGVLFIGLLACFGQAYANQCYPDVKDAYAYILAQEKLRQNPIININTASVGELVGLEGVGIKTAQAIVAYRQQVGRFYSIDDLTHVKGIGQKTVDKNRHRLTVQ